MMRLKLASSLLSGLILAACGPTNSDPAPPGPAASTAASAAAAPVASTAREPGVVAAPNGLGVRFEHAAGLQLRPCDGDIPRCVVLVDPTAEDFMRDLVTVQVSDGPLEAVAASEAGFMRDAEGRLMTTYGRFEPVAVERFTVDGKPGMRAVITCGISDPETGFHAAAGECLWAVASDGQRSVVVSSSGFGNGLEAAGAVVPSLRFTAPR